MSRQQKPKGPAWHTLEQEGLNQSPGETIDEATDRLPKKVKRAHELDLSDSADREESATASYTMIIEDLQDAESRQNRMHTDIPKSYAAGVPVAEISAGWGITSRQVYKILKEQGVTLNRRS